MSHSNISVFVPHLGCPGMCSFCNQRSISGTQTAPTEADVKRVCAQALREVKDKENCEIAFFGGSFTAIDRDYMITLLEAAQEFIGEGKFHGIRISTRPDFIDDEVLKLLKGYNVTAVELGAQSMKDKVLSANNRGHTAEDVYKACELIKKYDFELGLQMMIGLYKSTPEDELETMERILSVNPKTVRIYPVTVLKNTELARLYEMGEYKLFSFDEAVFLAAEMLEAFHEKGIEVIRCGLHASDNVEGEAVAGFYHPAFKEICESLIYKRKMERLLAEQFKESSAEMALTRLTFGVNQKCISKALGHKKSNVLYFKEKGIDIKVVGNKDLEKYQCILIDNF